MQLTQVPTVLKGISWKLIIVSFVADCCKCDSKILNSPTENSKNMLQDMWRLNQLDRSTVDPNHPYCKFSTGNHV